MKMRKNIFDVLLILSLLTPSHQPAVQSKMQTTRSLPLPLASDKLKEKDDKIIVDFCKNFEMEIGESVDNLDPNRISSFVVKGLEMIQNQTHGTKRMTYIGQILELIQYQNREEHISDKFVYLNILPHETTEGFIIRNYDNINSLAGSTIQFLEDHDVIDLAKESDNNVVEVVVYIPERLECLGKMDFYVLNAKDFSEDGKHICKTRILGIHWICPDMDIESILKIYLKITDYKQLWYTQGYWFQLALKSSALTLVCVSEPQDNICAGGSVVFITRRLSGCVTTQIGNVTDNNEIGVDILSQLALSMSPKSKDQYQRHSNVLKVIMLVGSSSSMVGILLIIACSIFFNGWYKKRICSIQLSLVFLCEIVFFLLEERTLTYVLYLFFYYTLLTQFTWMCVIGYIQYGKFIKVFDNVELSVVKLTFIGWLPSVIFILIPTLIYSECLECDLCYKNSSVLAYFVVIPISIIIIGNTIVYGVIMYKLFHTSFTLTEKAKKARLRAAIMFPFLFGISWISIFAMLLDWPTVSLIGSYFFHIIVPSQGFVLSIFVVILDKETRDALLRILRKLSLKNLPIPPGLKEYLLRK